MSTSDRPANDPAEGRLLDEEREGRAQAALERYRTVVDGDLHDLLASRALEHIVPMRYHLGWQDSQGLPATGSGGKMLRAALCLLSCEAVGGDRRRALPAATALELLHNFTLIHDDIEDGSALRHGRETVWRLWGQSQAINVGDGMFALANLSLLRLRKAGASPEVVTEATRLLNEACLSVCEGQYLDISFEAGSAITRKEYVAMAEGKTAALMAACCAVGALIGGAAAPAQSSMKEFGLMMGLAFQVRDDILGIWGEPSATGKPAGDDIRARKKSFPIVVAFEHAAEIDRDALHVIFERAGMGEEQVMEALSILERCDARGESERAADEYVHRAVAALEGVALVRERRLDLEALAAYAARRAR